MGMPSRVIYLPPGVAPPALAPQVQQVMPTGIPFDRVFFEQFLPQAIAAFCIQVKCDAPIVELLTMDGTTHFVRGIAGVADSWVALHTRNDEHGHAVQAFVAYQSIFRVELHPCDDSRRPLGFVTNEPNLPVFELAAEPPAPEAPVTEPQAAPAASKRARGKARK